eukprot:Clim_evm18s240 gene=Clim_evmTU18s240
MDGEQPYNPFLPATQSRDPLRTNHLQNKEPRKDENTESKASENVSVPPGRPTLIRSSTISNENMDPSAVATRRRLRTSITNTEASTNKTYTNNAGIEFINDNHPVKRFPALAAAMAAHQSQTNGSVGKSGPRLPSAGSRRSGGVSFDRQVTLKDAPKTGAGGKVPEGPAKGSTPVSRLGLNRRMPSYISPKAKEINLSQVDAFLEERANVFGMENAQEEIVTQQNGGCSSPQVNSRLSPTAPMRASSLLAASSKSLATTAMRTSQSPYRQQIDPSQRAHGHSPYQSPDHVGMGQSYEHDSTASTQSDRSLSSPHFFRAFMQYLSPGTGPKTMGSSTDIYRTYAEWREQQHTSHQHISYMSSTTGTSPAQSSHSSLSWSSPQQQQNSTTSSLMAVDSPLYNADSPQSYLDQCFDTVDVLGQGSFGCVYHVRSRDDGGVYAVKVSKRRFASRPHKQEALKEVATWLKIIGHENILRLFRAWEENGFLYIQMEKATGSLESMVSHLQEYRERPHVLDLLRFGLDIATGIQHMHRKGYVHLDVKPGNVFLFDTNTWTNSTVMMGVKPANDRALWPADVEDHDLKRGNSNSNKSSWNCRQHQSPLRYRAKLGDFGVALHIDDPHLPDGIGDGPYIGKEFLDSSNGQDYGHEGDADSDGTGLNGHTQGATTTVGPWSDVFALGMTLLEIARGQRVPGRGAEWHELRSGVIPDAWFCSPVGNHMTSGHQTERIMPPALEALIRTCLSPHQLQRPTIDCCVGELTAMLKQEEWRYSVGRWVSPRALRRFGRSLVDPAAWTAALAAVWAAMAALAATVAAYFAGLFGDSEAFDSSRARIGGHGRPWTMAQGRSPGSTVGDSPAIHGHYLSQLNSVMEPLSEANKPARRDSVGAHNSPSPLGSFASGSVGGSSVQGSSSTRQQPPPSLSPGLNHNFRTTDSALLYGQSQGHGDRTGGQLQQQNSQTPSSNGDVLWREPSEPFGLKGPLDFSVTPSPDANSLLRQQQRVTMSGGSASASMVPNSIGKGIPTIPMAIPGSSPSTSSSSVASLPRRPSTVSVPSRNSPAPRRYLTQPQGQQLQHSGHNPPASPCPTMSTPWKAIRDGTSSTAAVMANRGSMSDSKLWVHPRSGRAATTGVGEALLEDHTAARSSIATKVTAAGGTTAKNGRTPRRELFDDFDAASSSQDEEVQHSTGGNDLHFEGSPATHPSPFAQEFFGGYRQPGAMPTSSPLQQAHSQPSTQESFAMDDDEDHESSQPEYSRRNLSLMFTDDTDSDTD